MRKIKCHEYFFRIYDWGVVNNVHLQELIHKL